MSLPSETKVWFATSSTEVTKSLSFLAILNVILLRMASGKGCIVSLKGKAIFVYYCMTYGRNCVSKYMATSGILLIMYHLILFGNMYHSSRVRLIIVSLNAVLWLWWITATWFHCLKMSATGPIKSFHSTQSVSSALYAAFVIVLYVQCCLSSKKLRNWFMSGWKHAWCEYDILEIRCSWRCLCELGKTQPL